MDSQSTFGKEPKLRSLPEIPNWINNIMGYCSSLNLSSLLLSNWSIPDEPVGNSVAANATRTERQLKLKQDERCYGIMLNCLSEFSDLRNRLMKLPTLNPSDALTFVPRGSLLYRAIVAAGLSNAGDAYYRGILDEISACKQGSKDYPDHAKELDNLFAQLPDSLAFSDAMKRSILQSSIHPDLNTMATASSLQPGITYSIMSSHLLGEHYRLATKRKSEAAALTEASKNKVAIIEDKEPVANYSNFANLHGGRTAYNKRNRGRENFKQTDTKAKFSGTCNNCKKVGHKKADCWAKGGPKERNPPHENSQKDFKKRVFKKSKG